jgi:Domain of unknown function (DUF5134)
VVGGEAARWVLSVLFAGCGGWFIYDLSRAVRQRRAGGASHAVAAGWHVLMCAAMVSMLWAWGSVIPPIAQAVVFTGAAAWFVGRAMLVVGPAGSRPCEPRRTTAGLSHWYHAAMMAAMVWMAVAASVPAAVVPGAVADAAGTMAMPGMSMPASAGGATRPPGWVAAICLVAGIALGGAAAWYCVSLARRLLVTSGPARSRPVLLAHAANAVAAAGMATVLFAMA